MVNPIPSQAVELAQKYSEVHFYEEHVANGGVAGRFGLMMLENGYDKKYRSHCIENYVIKQATVPQLWKICKLDSETIISDFKGE